MWYEIVPTLTIMLLGLGLPSIGTKYLCTMLYDTPIRRNIGERWDMHMFLRDKRLCGQSNIAKHAVLENIPDD